MRNSGFGGAPFMMGTFAGVPMEPGPHTTIQVPYPTMVFNVYNRYLPQYWMQRPGAPQGFGTPGAERHTAIVRRGG